MPPEVDQGQPAFVRELRKSPNQVAIPTSTSSKKKTRFKKERVERIYLQYIFDFDRLLQLVTTNVHLNQMTKTGPKINKFHSKRGDLKNMSFTSDLLDLHQTLSKKTAKILQRRNTAMLCCEH